MSVGGGVKVAGSVGSDVGLAVGAAVSVAVGVGVVVRQAIRIKDKTTKKIKFNPVDRKRPKLNGPIHFALVEIESLLAINIREPQIDFRILAPFFLFSSIDLSPSWGG